MFPYKSSLKALEKQIAIKELGKVLLPLFTSIYIYIDNLVKDLKDNFYLEPVIENNHSILYSDDALVMATTFELL